MNHSIALIGALTVSLLAGCTTGPRPYPAPVEHRNQTPRPYPQAEPRSNVEVIPQPGYDSGFSPADGDDYDADDDYGFAPMEAPPSVAEPPQPEPQQEQGAALESPESPTQALTDKARQQAAAGQYEAAAGSLERALRIAPKDPALWMELAKTRLAQGEIDEAADLAIKSRTLAIGQPGLQARSWRLLAQIREQQGDIDAADQALETAAELESLIR